MTTASARGARNRQVGAIAEREAQQLLEQITGHEVIRMRVRVGADGRSDDRADLIILSPCAVGVEVKAARSEGTVRGQILAGVRQMIAQDRRSPMMHRVVILRAPRGRWLAAREYNPAIDSGIVKIKGLSPDVVTIVQHGTPVLLDVGNTTVRVSSIEHWWMTS
jgi:hypothetical protein